MRPKTSRLLTLMLSAMLASCASQTERSSSGAGTNQAEAAAPAPQAQPAPPPAPAYEPEREAVQFVDRPLEQTPPPKPAPAAAAPKDEALPDFPITKYEIEPEEEVGDLGTQPDESGTMSYAEEQRPAAEDLVSEPTTPAEEPEAPAQVAEAPAPAPQPAPEPQWTSVSFEAEPLFNFDKSFVRTDQRGKLDKFVASLKDTEYDSISVIGYTDRIGTEAYNQKLSERRANAVKAYLVRHGVPAGKIVTEGRGKSQPVTGDTCKGDKKTKALIDCLQPDRRVDIGVSGKKRAD